MLFRSPPPPPPEGQQEDQLHGSIRGRVLRASAMWCKQTGSCERSWAWAPALVRAPPLRSRLTSWSVFRPRGEPVVLEPVRRSPLPAILAGPPLAPTSESEKERAVTADGDPLRLAAAPPNQARLFFSSRRAVSLFDSAPITHRLHANTARTSGEGPACCLLGLSLQSTTRGRHGGGHPALFCEYLPPP